MRSAMAGDPFTEKAIELLREELGRMAEIYFVFTGTAANVLGLAGVTQLMEFGNNGIYRPYRGG